MYDTPSLPIMYDKPKMSHMCYIVRLDSSRVATLVKVRNVTRVSSSDPTRVNSNYIPHILRFYGKSNAAPVAHYLIHVTCWIHVDHVFFLCVSSECSGKDMGSPEAGQRVNDSERDLPEAGQGVSDSERDLPEAGQGVSDSERDSLETGQGVRDSERDSLEAVGKASATPRGTRQRLLNKFGQSENH